jgi:hypothetical protein
MTPFTFPVNRNSKFFLLKRILIFFLAAILVLKLLTGCHSPGTGDTTTTKDSTNNTKKDSIGIAGKDSTDSVSSRQHFLNGNLTILYTPADSLFRLIRRERLANSPKGKLVFQFYIKNSDTLTLASFSGGKHSVDYDSMHVLVLQVSKNVRAHLRDSLFLGNQEISNKKNNTDLTALRDTIMNHHVTTPTPHYEGFVAFIPSVIKLTTNLQSSYTIRYSLYYAATEKEIEDYSDLESFQLVNQIGHVTLNPSPPRNGY